MSPRSHGGRWSHPPSPGGRPAHCIVKAHPPCPALPAAPFAPKEPPPTASLPGRAWGPQGAGGEGSWGGSCRGAALLFHICCPPHGSPARPTAPPGPGPEVWCTGPSRCVTCWDLEPGLITLTWPGGGGARGVALQTTPLSWAQRVGTAAPCSLPWAAGASRPGLTGPAPAELHLRRRGFPP